MRKILLAALAASVLFPITVMAQASGSAQTWQEYREANSEAFRLPAYVPPAGQWYRRTTVGASLSPPFYARSYWINNYADYHLPAPRDDQKYVRHGNDVLLMIIRSGRVVEVYKDFFL